MTYYILLWQMKLCDTVWVNKYQKEHQIQISTRGARHCALSEGAKHDAQ